MNYSNDCSLFISFTTMPFRHQEEFKEDIRDIFHGYKQKQLLFATHTDQNENFKTVFQDYFYEPSFYYLFGSYDLAVISLIDDYTLANRNFHPYSYYIAKNRKRKGRLGGHSDNFKYQIISGPAPILDISWPENSNESIEENLLTNNPLIKTASRTFLSQLNGSSTLFPFIGISRIKLNNGLLIGGGARFVGLTQTILFYYLKNRAEELEKQGINLDFVITESVGWHEITVTFFANDLKVISDLIVSFREWRLGQLEILIRRFAQNRKIEKSLQKLFRFSRDKSLLNQLINFEKSINKKRSHFMQFEEGEREAMIRQYIRNHYSVESDFLENIGVAAILRSDTEEAFQTNSTYHSEQSPVFLKTLTSFGFDCRFADGNLPYEQLPNHYFRAFDINTEQERFFTKWTVKPGHLNRALEAFKQVDETQQNYTGFVAGPEDYIFPHERPKQGFLNILKTHQEILQKAAADFAHHDIRKVNSLASFTYSFRELYELVTIHDEERPAADEGGAAKAVFNFGDRLKYLAFSLEEISSLRLKLYKCNVSKILREKVLNVFVNYNDGIQDEVLFPYFLGLRQFLSELIRTIELISSESYSQDGELVHHRINKMVEQFEMAYRNRFQQSYRMDGITDFNIEFNGGCQQIILALEATYKAISSSFGDDPFQPASIVYSSGLSGVHSSQYCMRLNYFHLFQPSIFFAPSVKEAANQIFRSFFADRESDHQAYRGIIESVFDGAIEELEELLTSAPFNSYELAFENEVPRTLQSIISDLFSYYYNFNADDELYTFWTWCYFLQMSEMYDTDSSIHYQPFVRFLLRYIVVMKYCGKEQALNQFNQNIIERKLYPCKQIRSLWLTHYHLVNKMADRLLDRLVHLNLVLSSATRWAIHLTAQDLVIKAKELIDQDLENEQLEEQRNGATNRFKEALFFSSSLKKEENKQLKIFWDKQSSNIEQVLAFTKAILKENLPSFLQEELPAAIFDQDRKLKEDSALRSALMFKRHFDLRTVFDRGELFQFRFHNNRVSKIAFKNESIPFYIQTIKYGYLKLLYHSFCKKEADQNYPVFPVWQRNEFSWLEEPLADFNSFYNNQDELTSGQKQELQADFFFDYMYGKGQVLPLVPGSLSIDPPMTMESYQKLKELYGADLYFDPMGGLHATNFQVRRKYFKYRSAVIRSLWDFALRYQKMLLLGNFSEKKKLVRES